MKIINYKEEFGPYTFPEGFEALLNGLPIEKQMTYYRTTEYHTHSMTNWSQRTVQSGYKTLAETRDVTALIVKDGILVGVMMVDDNGQDTPCFSEQRVCTYYADDNNGAGSKCRIDYTYLVCVPENF